MKTPNLTTGTNARRTLRQFKVFVFAANNSSIIESEDDVCALNYLEARKPLIDKGIPAHRIYCLDVTK